MSTAGNKRLLQDALAAMAAGDLAPLFDAMADDMKWRWMGTEQWSHTFDGKDAVVNGLFAAAGETLAGDSHVVVHNVVAEGDYVVVEHSGRNTTPDGRRYDNNYCWVCRFEAGKLRELREYMDTRLVTEVFGVDERQ